MEIVVQFTMEKERLMIPNKRAKNDMCVYARCVYYFGIRRKGTHNKTKM